MTRFEVVGGHPLWPAGMVYERRGELGPTGHRMDFVVAAGNQWGPEGTVVIEELRHAARFPEPHPSEAERRLWV